MFLKMMKNFVPLLLLLLMTSCGVFKNVSSDKKNLNYMQNIDSIATQAAVDQRITTIQPGDELMIYVSAKDLDVAKPFNQNFSSGQMVQNAIAGGNLRENPTADSGPTYIVDSKGNIDFPVLGERNTTGKTIEEFKEDLRQALKEYITNPVVSVKNTNYKITILGEVNRPGQYIVPDANATFLNALGLAGDLTIYGKRDNVLLVRNVDGKTTNTRIDLNDAKFINSPYYYLKQGDVIYVTPNSTKEKTSRLDPNTGLYISIASIAITIIALIVRK